MNRSNNAFEEIINNTRYNGQIQSIAWLTSLVDGWFVKIISFCGFFIISIVFLKCALMGLYCSYPKLFDQIHDIKESCRNARSGGKPAGTAMWALSWLIPDVKAFTDMDERAGQGSIGREDIKTILMKTMVSGAIFVMVGTAIYNGYYRDFMGMLSKLGGHVFDTYILNLDLSDMFDETVNAGKDYTWGFASTTKGTAEQAFAKAIYDDVRNYYGHAYVNTEADRSRLGQNIEQWVCGSEVFGLSTGGVGGTTTIEDLFGNDNINLAYDVTHLENKISSVQETADSSRFETTIWKMISDFGHQTTEEGFSDTSWLRITITATPKSAQSSEAKYIEYAGGLSINTEYWTTGDGTKTYSLYIPYPSDKTSSIPPQFSINGITFKKTTSEKDGFFLYTSNQDGSGAINGNFSTSVSISLGSATISKINLTSTTAGEANTDNTKLYLGSQDVTGQTWSTIYDTAVSYYKSQAAGTSTDTVTETTTGTTDTTTTTTTVAAKVKN
jgi:hypothetical protein